MVEVGNLRAVEAATGDPDSLPTRLARSARILTENGTDEAPLIGFVTVAVYADGAYSQGFSCPTDHPFMGPTMFTAYVREIIEREMTGQMAAEEYALRYLV